MTFLIAVPGVRAEAVQARGPVLRNSAAERVLLRSFSFGELLVPEPRDNAGVAFSSESGVSRSPARPAPRQTGRLPDRRARSSMVGSSYMISCYSCFFSFLYFLFLFSKEVSCGSLARVLGTWRTRINGLHPVQARYINRHNCEIVLRYICTINLDLPGSKILNLRLANLFNVELPKQFTMDSMGWARKSWRKVTSLCIPASRRDKRLSNPAFHLLRTTPFSLIGENCKSSSTLVIIGLKAKRARYTSRMDGEFLKKDWQDQGPDMIEIKVP